jgi:hypothetical protein
VEQCLHLLIVDRSEDLVLVDWHQGRWLLPVFGSRERQRVAPLSVRHTARRGVAADAVGQWLGRVSASLDATDWLVVVRTRTVSNGGAASAGWRSPRSLRAESAVLEYQHWALDRTLACGERPRVPGPFGHPDWTDPVYAWIEKTAGTLARDDIVTYRISAYAVVMKLPPSSGTMYFKGLAPPAGEAALTLALSRLAPRSFARTHALETGQGGELWWLTNECPGTTLARAPSLDGAVSVAEECGRLQRTLSSSLLDGLTPVVPEMAAAWSLALLQTSGAVRLIDDACARIYAACRDVVSADEPIAWVPLDLDPSNVLLDRGQVRFIDLEESHRGPAPLAIATFARRFSRLTSARPVPSDFSRRIYSAYERGRRRPALAPSLWHAFEIVSMLLEMHAGWRRVLRNIERGELHAPLEFIERRLAHRLMRHVLGEATETG